MNFIRKIILVAFCIFFIVCTYLLVNGYSLYKSVLKETSLEEKINELEIRKIILKLKMFRQTF